MAATPAKKTPATKGTSSLSDLLGKKDDVDNTEKVDTSHDEHAVETSHEHAHVAMNKGKVDNSEATKDPKKDVPEHLTSDVDRRHDYADLKKGEHDDTVDSKVGATEAHVVPVSESNAVHTGITDNYPNDWEVPNDYPPNESGLTRRNVLERHYAAPNPHDDKFDPAVMHRIKNVDENQDDAALNSEELMEHEVENKMEKIQEADANAGNTDNNPVDDDKNDKNDKSESK